MQPTTPDAKSIKAATVWLADAQYHCKQNFEGNPYAEETLDQRCSTLRISIAEIQEAVAKCFDVTVEDLKDQTRRRDIIAPRHIAMYLTKEMTRNSLPGIGRSFGNRDHSTVIHAVNKIASLREGEPSDEHVQWLNRTIVGLKAQIIADKELAKNEQPFTPRNDDDEKKNVARLTAANKWLKDTYLDR